MRARTVYVALAKLEKAGLYHPEKWGTIIRFISGPTMAIGRGKLRVEIYCMGKVTNRIVKLLCPMAIASAIVVEVGIFGCYINRTGLICEGFVNLADAEYGLRLMILLNLAMERGLSILVLLRYNITVCVY